MLRDTREPRGRPSGDASMESMHSRFKGLTWGKSSWSGSHDPDRGVASARKGDRDRTTMRLAILADDLTGALDSSAAFAASGLRTEVWLSPDAAPPMSAATPDVVSVTTETREAPPGQAGLRAAACARTLRELGAARFYKKMDSTLRGPWVAELVELRNSGLASRVVVCPAFPAQGRIMREGRVLARGFLVGDLIRELRHPALGAVRSVEDAEALRQALADGFFTTAVDAATDDDLRAIAAAAWDAGPGTLPCGSGGLARALATVMVPAGWSRSVDLRHQGRLLIAVGTRNELSRRQLVALESAWQLEPGLRKRLRILATDPAADPLATDPTRSVTLAGRVLTDHARQPVEVFAFTGGETALQALKALGCQRLTVLGEWEPGLPVARIVGGVAAGRLCVTKAGGFGDAGTLLRLARAVLEE